MKKMIKSGLTESSFTIKKAFSKARSLLFSFGVFVLLIPNKGVNFV